MENPIDTFTKSAQEVRLGGEAKARMRDRLVAHMEVHLVLAEPIRSPYQRFLDVLSPFISTLRTPVAALMLLVLVAAGGATTYAAALALPGEPLYPLKVNVLEPAKGLLAHTSEAKVALSVSLTETRLNEVEQLIVQKKLTAEEGEKSKERFDRSLRVARVTLEKLSRDNPEAAAKIEASFSVSLDAHESVLKGLAIEEASSTNAVEAHLFADHVRSEVISAMLDTSVPVATSTPVQSESGATPSPSLLEVEAVVETPASAEVEKAADGIIHRLSF